MPSTPVLLLLLASFIAPSLAWTCSPLPPLPWALSLPLQPSSACPNASSTPPWTVAINLTQSSCSYSICTPAACAVQARATGGCSLLNAMSLPPLLTPVQVGGDFILNDTLLHACAALTPTFVCDGGATGVAIGGTAACSDNFTLGWMMTTSTPCGDATPASLRVNLTAPASASNAYAERLLPPLASQPYNALSMNLNGSVGGGAWVGAGLQYTHYDLTGRRVPIFTREQGVGRGAQPLTLIMNLSSPGAGGDDFTSYSNVPLLLSTAAGTGLALNSSEYAVFDIDAGGLEYSVMQATIDMTFLLYAAPDVLTAAAQYARSMQCINDVDALLPPWAQAGGAVLGLQGGTAAVSAALDQVMAVRPNASIAAVWLQDWSGQRNFSGPNELPRVGLWWNWEVDDTWYPGWDTFVAQLLQQGIHTLTYVNPMLVNITARGTPFRRNLYAEALAAGYFVAGSNGQPWVGYSNASLLDLRRGEVQAWLQDVIAENVWARGIVGFMADFGEELPLIDVASLGQHGDFPASFAATVAAAQGGNTTRTFFMRSMSPRSIAHAPAFWMGDQTVTWDSFDGLQSAVIGLMSASLAGAPVLHFDIGGYSAIDFYGVKYIRTKELFMRSAEAAAFTFAMRTHLGTLPNENWQLNSDNATIEHFFAMVDVFDSLALYRLQLLRAFASAAVPPIRHTTATFPSVGVNASTRTAMNTQFMLGPQLLVAPVMTPGDVDVAVILPPRTCWQHALTNATISTQNASDWVVARVAAPIGTPCALWLVDVSRCVDAA